MVKWSWGLVTVLEGWRRQGLVGAEGMVGWAYIAEGGIDVR